MKKIVTLLLAVMMTALLMTPAMAESSLSDLLDSLNGLLDKNTTTSSSEPTEEELEKVIYDMVLGELNTAKLNFDAQDDYSTVYYSMNLNNETVMGNYADVAVFSYWDGVCINASYPVSTPAAAIDEAVRFCNMLNTNIYIGKFTMDEYDNNGQTEIYACYEVFLPMNAQDLHGYDRYSVMEYAYFTIDILTYYADYFNAISNGESADNVYAMWVADNY